MQYTEEKGLPSSQLPCWDQHCRPPAGVSLKQIFSGPFLQVSACPVNYFHGCQLGCLGKDAYILDKRPEVEVLIESEPSPQIFGELLAISSCYGCGQIFLYPSNDCLYRSFACYSWAPEGNTQAAPCLFSCCLFHYVISYPLHKTDSLPQATSFLAS